MTLFEILAAPATPQAAGGGFNIAVLLTALGGGAIIKAVVDWFLRDRKKQATDNTKTDVDTKLAYLNTVIERLDEENKRIITREERTSSELAAEQDRSAKLRSRVRELEDEIDGVRRSARETEQKCDVLSVRLGELLGDAQEKE